MDSINQKLNATVYEMEGYGLSQDFFLSCPPIEKQQIRDFPGSLVVKTSPSNAAGVSLTPIQGTKIPPDSWLKNKNIKQKQYFNKFNKTLKMVHIKLEKNKRQQ